MGLPSESDTITKTTGREFEELLERGRLAEIAYKAAEKKLRYVERQILDAIARSRG